MICPLHPQGSEQRCQALHPQAHVPGVYAVKIIDVTGGGSFSPEEVQELREATQKEVDILRKVSGHPNISE